MHQIDLMKNSDSSAVQVRILWQTVFGDDDAFVDTFIMRYYSRSRMLCAEREGRMAAMLHLLPFESELGRTTYVYGVATAPEFRGRGLAAELMREAMHRIEARGDDAAVLIPTPGQEWLRTFYGRYGFSGSVPAVFRTKDGFDFGTGDTAQDRAMVWRRDASAPLPESLELTHSLAE